jgi:hypothetical protein
MTPFTAADAMTAWAAARSTVTTIDVFGHNEDGRPTRDQFEIRPAGNLYNVRCPAGGASRQEGSALWNYDRPSPAP